MSENIGPTIDDIDFSRKSDQEKELRDDSRKQLGSILNKPVTMDGIDTYAEEALDKLVGLVSEKTERYKETHLTTNWDDQTIEDAAMKWCGLEEVNFYLDFIDKKNDELKGLDKVIGKADRVNEVIVNPDRKKIRFEGSGAGLTEKKMVNRLKTILFILKEDFEVDVDNPDHLTLTKGMVDNKMMRKTSYFLVSALKIDRKMLVCDEGGNASYVFDAKVLKSKGIDDKKLIGATKEELNQWIAEVPEMGKRVFYSKDGFVPRIIEAINQPIWTKPDKVTKSMENTGNYLLPKAPEGYLSLNGIRRKYGMASETVKRIIKKYSDEIGLVETYRFGTKCAKGYSPKQEEVIIEKVELEGLLCPLAPEGYLSLNGIARKYEMASETVKQIIEKYPDEIGQTKILRFRNVITEGYSPKQERTIIEKLELEGYLSPPAPEGYLSLTSIAKEFGIFPTTIKSVIDKYSDEIGLVETYRFGTKCAKGYSPKQEEVIIEKVELEGLLRPLAPEGYLSLNGIARKYEMASETVKQIIEKYPDEIGQTKILRFRNGVITEGYSPKQERTIIEKLELEGYLSPPAPEGYLSLSVIARKYGVANRTVKQIIEKYPDEIGLVETYRFGTKFTKGYSPEQIEKIGQLLEAERAAKARAV